MEKKSSGIKIIAANKKASFNYFLSEFLECGIELLGTEIKSLRSNGCSLVDSYVVIRNEQFEILNMHIAPFKQANIFNAEPLRTRKLLAHKKEIYWYADKIKKGGFTLVPTKVYFKGGRVKVEIALAKGKKLYDKRETIKKRDLDREQKNY